MSRLISFLILLAVIGLLSVLSFKILANFLVPLFLAALLVVIFRPLHFWILEKVGGRPRTAAMLTTLGILLTVLIPLSLLTLLAIGEGRDAVNSFNPGVLADKAREMRSSLNLDLPIAAEIRAIDQKFDEMIEADGANDLHIHQEAWFAVKQQSELIAAKLELSSEPESRAQPVPESPDEEPDDATSEEPAPELSLLEANRSDDPWQQFINLQQAANKLEYEINQLATDTADEQVAKSEQLHEYHDLIAEARSSFQDARNRILGGKSWATVKLLANPDDEQISEYSSRMLGYVRDWIVNLGSSAGTFLMSLSLGSFIMIIALYFFLLDGPKMMTTLHGLFPMDDDHERELVSEFNSVSRAVVLATLLSALAQGLLAGIGFYFCGLDSIFLLTVLTCALAMIPFVGAAAVWAPCCLYLYFFEGNTVAAIGLAVYGVAVISMVDNIIKPYILHGQSKLHPLIALLSVLGGITALGPIGILVGPMVVVFLQTLLKILQREMSAMERNEGNEWSPFAAANGFDDDDDSAESSSTLKPDEADLNSSEPDTTDPAVQPATE